MGMEKFLCIAMDIAEDAHKGQVDKSGQPYITHPIAVSKMGKTIEEKLVGLLHDVVEDSEWTLNDLRKAGIPEVIVEGVDRMTRRPIESVKSYMNRVKETELSIKVKLNDLAHNSDKSRISNWTETDQRRLDKYHRQTKELEEVLKCLKAS
jgi:GTP diphosphokinase / guanosine-3',5'-bis(diphosphate) 3'-diphosphatase